MRWVWGIKKKKNSPAIAQWENIKSAKNIFKDCTKLVKNDWHKNKFPHCGNANHLVDNCHFKNKVCFRSNVSGILIKSIDRMEGKNLLGGKRMTEIRQWKTLMRMIIFLFIKIWRNWSCRQSVYHIHHLHRT